MLSLSILFIKAALPSDTSGLQVFWDPREAPAFTDGAPEFIFQLSIFFFKVYLVWKKTRTSDQLWCLQIFPFFLSLSVGNIPPKDPTAKCKFRDPRRPGGKDLHRKWMECLNESFKWHHGNSQPTITFFLYLGRGNFPLFPSLLV